MRITAPLQNDIIKLLTDAKRAMSLRELTNSCKYTYHQVTSVLLALRNKGYVRRVRCGVYEATEDARLLIVSPEEQILVLKARIEFLENEVRGLLIRMSKLGRT